MASGLAAGLDFPGFAGVTHLEQRATTLRQSLCRQMPSGTGPGVMANGAG